MNSLPRQPHYTLPRLVLVLVAVLFFSLSSRLAFAAPQRQENPDRQENSTQTLLVHFAADSTPELRAAWIAQMGGELVAWMPQIGVAEVRLLGQDVAAAAAQPLMASDIIAYAEADQVVSATYDPDDPDFSDDMMSYGLKHVQALDAWDIVTGSQEIVIAVIDTGINAEHPEFAGRLVDGYDFINNDHQPEDLSGHGTHVAGVIAAALDNGEGVAGVCPNCTLMPVKVLNRYNLGSWSQLAQGILFAADNGARVINLSLGATSRSETLARAIDYAIESGVVVVASAGNNGSDRPFYPAAFDGVIGVSATTIKGEHWAKSDFGSYIDLSAPGELIYSTYHKLDNAYRGYTYMSGTSMAAPFVSGVAGLLFSVEPNLGAEQVIEAMRLGADDLGPDGWDADFGFGRINAKGALMAPVEGLIEAVGEITAPKQDSRLFLPTLSNN